MPQLISILHSRVTAENTNVTVPQSGNTTLLELPVEGVAALGISLAVADQNLDTFLIQGRMSPNDSYQTLYSEATDFTAPAGTVIDASGDLTTLAAGTSGWVMLNTLGLYSVKILASSGNAAGSTVTIRAIGKG